MEYERILEALESMESMYFGGNSAPRLRMEEIKEAAQAWKMREELSMLENEVGVYL